MTAFDVSMVLQTMMACVGGKVLQLCNTDRSQDTDIVVQLRLLFGGFIKRCCAEVGDGNTAARVQLEQEDQASSALFQCVCEHLPLI